MSSDRHRRFRRSPLLFVIWCDGEPVLVQADTLIQVRAHAELLDMLTALGDWSTADELAARGRVVDEKALDALGALGILEHDASGAAPPSRPWDPLELAVHRRTSRVGEPTGDQHPCDPVPRRAPIAGGRRVSLPTPEPLRTELGQVLEARRTERSYAARPLRLSELSQLLHHSARVITTPGGTGERRRPFASAGARNELKIYVIANEVDGLEPGAWYYDPVAHLTEAVRERDARQVKLNDWVNEATGRQLSREPPAILLITAVVGAMSSKYGHLALSLIYKNVGCLLENLYLVSAAIGLAPCAIGGGDEPATSRWLGLDPLAETQVGCFLVGPAA